MARDEYSKIYIPAVMTRIGKSKETRPRAGGARYNLDWDPEDLASGLGVTIPHPMPLGKSWVFLCSNFLFYKMGELTEIIIWAPSKLLNVLVLLTEINTMSGA